METIEDVHAWLKSDGFKIFCELKHGPIGEVLALLADGCVSRSKAAEAIAELLVGRTPALPKTDGSEFAEYETPGETVRELHRRIAELEAALNERTQERDALAVVCAKLYEFLTPEQKRFGQVPDITTVLLRYRDNIERGEVQP